MPSIRLCYERTYLVVWTGLHGKRHSSWLFPLAKWWSHCMCATTRLLHRTKSRGKILQWSSGIMHPRTGILFFYHPITLPTHTGALPRAIRNNKHRWIESLWVVLRLAEKVDSISTIIHSQLCTSCQSNEYSQWFVNIRFKPCEVVTW